MKSKLAYKYNIRLQDNFFKFTKYLAKSTKQYQKHKESSEI